MVPQRFASKVSALEVNLGHSSFTAVAAPQIVAVVLLLDEKTQSTMGLVQGDLHVLFLQSPHLSGSLLAY